MISLLNNTKSVSRIGYLVTLDPVNPQAFVYATPNSTRAIGIVTEASDYRKPCKIATIGDKCKVFVSGNAVKDALIRCAKSGDNISLGANAVVKSTDTNYLKIGTALTSGSGLIETVLELIFVGAGSGSLLVDAIQFNTNPPAITNAEGLLIWNSTDGTLDLGMSGGDITMQIGQELFTKVVNKSGAPILNGKVVRFDGRLGNRPKIVLAQGDSDVNGRVTGLTTQDIADDAEGYITTTGYVRGIKTNYAGWSAGDRLWVSKTVAGELTNVEPTEPHHSDIVGSVGIVHLNLGSILVDIDRHFTLEEMSNVDGTPPSFDGQFYKWNNATGVWEVTIDPKMGSSTDYTTFDSTGHQTMIGTAQPWDDLRIEPSVRQAAETGVPVFEKYFDDAAGTSRGVFLYSFTNEITVNQKEVFFTTQMPHAWNGGAILMHVHWTPAATENNTEVIWGLEYCWKDIGEVFGDTTIVYSSGTLVPDDANITAGKHYISEFVDLTPGTTADGISSILIGRIFRFSGDASDTYTNKVGLMYIDAHYQINSLGSTDEYLK